VVGPNDAYCSFCGRPLPAAWWPAPSPISSVGSTIPPPGPITSVAPPPDLPPPEPCPPSSPAPAGFPESLSSLNLPPPLLAALIVLPAACFFVAALVVSSVASSLGDEPVSFGPQASVASVQVSTSTPTVVPSTTSTGTRTGTPTGTKTATPASVPSGTTTPGGTPTMTPDPGWKPRELKLEKDTPAVAVTADKLFTGVALFSYTDNFVYEIMGRGENCRGMPNGRGILVRRSNGVPSWQSEQAFLDLVTLPNNGFRIRADDPGLKAKQWVTYPCP
jgi:hypothetical protein